MMNDKVIVCEYYFNNLIINFILDGVEDLAYFKVVTKDREQELYLSFSTVYFPFGVIQMAHIYVDDEDLRKYIEKMISDTGCMFSKAEDDDDDFDFEYIGEKDALKTVLGFIETLDKYIDKEKAN